MNIKAWIHSAVVAILSMVVGAVEQYFQSGGVLPQNSVQWHSFIASIAGTAVLGVTALLKSSPLLPPPPVNLSSNVPNSTSASKYGGLLPLMVLAFLLVPFLAGCTNWEKAAYQSLAASKAAIDQAQADYESGKLPHSVPVYDAVNKAKAAQTFAVDALVTYEQMKATGASAGALATAQADVETALASLPTILADVKALYTTKVTGIVYYPPQTRISQEAAYGQRI